MALTPGTLLGSFEIISPLGAGGMGEVYRARDTKLGRDVAFKVLPEAFATDAERLLRFQREAHLLASLNHPNIAQIYGLVESDRARGIAMELVEGETLQARLKRGPLALDEAVHIAKQIADALEAAHDRGIIHRDLKPGNIMIDGDGRVKVLDFGLAKSIEPAAADANMSHSPTLISMAATQASVLIGTAAYMSPEQVRGHAAGDRSDVWAFGCVLYEMLTGRQAFDGDTITDLIGGIVRIDPDWNGLPASTPPALRSLLKRCLEKDRKRRYHAIGDVRFDLEAALTPAVAAPAAVPKGRERLAWIAAVILLASIAAFAAMRYFSPAPAELLTSRFLIEFPPNASLGAAVATPFPLISPDGRYLAFTAVNSGAARIWLRPISSLAPQPIPGTDSLAAATNQAFWSRDNRFIGFFADGKLKKVAIAGGPPQTLCDANGTTLGGTWSQDDVILFENQGSLHRVGAGGGVSVPIRKPDKAKNEAAFKFPSFLPDGRHFLYVSIGTDAAHTIARVGSLDSDQDTDLFASNSRVLYSNAGHLLFVRDGTLMAQPFDARNLALTGDVFPLAEQVAFAAGNGSAAFSVSDNDTLVFKTTSTSVTELTWLDRAGMKIGTVPGLGNLQRPYLSFDQNRVAVQRIDGSSTDIWSIDLLRTTNSRLTGEGGDETYPVFSPDGKQIAFTSTRDGKLGFYLKAATNVGPEELIQVVQGGDPAITDWAADGKMLLYGFTTPDSGWDTWALPMSGERKPIGLFLEKYTEYRARFSPDGKWIAYTSNETGRNEIYIQTFPPSGVKQQVSVDGAVMRIGGGMVRRSCSTRWMGR